MHFAEAVTIFTGANRSGYLGVIAVGMMLMFFERKFKAVVLVAVIAGTVAYLLISLDMTGMLNWRSAAHI